jgi:hypothetical protein
MSSQDTVKSGPGVVANLPGQWRNKEMKTHSEKPKSFGKKLMSVLGLNSCMPELRATSTTGLFPDQDLSTRIARGDWDY